MKYKRLDSDKYTRGGYQVMAIREQDLLKIKKWRNEQMKVLRQSRTLTDEDQLRYYRQAVAPSFEQESPSIMLFSYFLNGELIGYGGLTNIDWLNDRAEISYLLDTERSSEHNVEQYTNDFSNFLSLMKEVAFTRLNIHRLFTETYDIRPLHVQVLESNGFKFEGRMRDHVKMDGSYVDSLLHACIKES